MKQAKNTADGGERGTEPLESTNSEPYHGPPAVRARAIWEISVQSDQPVLVDFWADWCPPCKAVAPVIEEIATKFDGIARVGKVDVDGNKSLAERYAISSIPTLLFFRNGEVVERAVGVVPKRELTAKLTALSERAPIEN